MKNKIIRFIIIFIFSLLWSSAFKIAFNHRPVIVDESSYIFQAQTFLEGRLSNPTPSFPTFFENQSLIIKPTFSSQYPPLLSIILASGEAIFSDMLWANIFVHALTASFIFLMLSLYLGPQTAFFIALMYGVWPPYALKWAGTYRSGDIIVLSATFLLISYKKIAPIYLSLGIIFLLLSRPFEGLFFSIPFVLYFLIHNKFNFSIRHGIAIIILALGFSFQFIHNKQVTGSYLSHPRSLVVKQYFYNPILNFLGEKNLDKKITEHEQLKKYYIDYELSFYEKQQTFTGYLETLWQKIDKNIRFHFSYYLIPFVIFGLFLLRNERSILYALFAYSIGFLFIIADLTIYTAILIPVGFLSIGKTIDLPIFKKQSFKFLVFTLFAFAFHNLFEKEVDYMTSRNNRSVYYKEEFSDALFERFNNQQLVAFVRYSKDHDIHNEWIYNHPELNSQNIIWVWDSGAEKNTDFMRGYKDRKFICLYIDNSMPIIQKSTCVH